MKHSVCLGPLCPVCHLLTSAETRVPGGEVEDHGNKSAGDVAPARDEKGRLLPGQTANPGGRPKAWKNYQIWLRQKALTKAKTALLECLESPDGKVKMMAIREVNDRLFGKPKQVITGEEGSPSVFGDDLATILTKLLEK